MSKGPDAAVPDRIHWITGPGRPGDLFRRADYRFVILVTNSSDPPAPIRVRPPPPRWFPPAEELLRLSHAMSDRDTFGPRLRAARERRGISLETLSTVTNVHTELWEGLERGDLSRWPSGIFARSFIRYYARAVGLEEDEVVNEFCRLFPNGDRRRRALIVGQAQLIGHEANVPDDLELPPEGERRAAVEPTEAPGSSRRPRIAPRALATVIDLTAVMSVGGAIALLFHAGFLAATGCVTIAYYGLSTITLGGSAGTRIVDRLRQRAPELFQVDDRRRAHA